MVEVAEELIEAVHCGQRFVAIADVVLAKLPCGVSKVLEQATHGRIELAHAHWCAGKPHLCKSAANAMLAGEKRCATCRARLLTIVMEELDTLSADAVDVRGLVTHERIRVGADVRDADVIAEDDQDVRPPGRRRRHLLLRERGGRPRDGSRRTGGKQRSTAEEDTSTIRSRRRILIVDGRAAEQDTAPVERAILRSGLRIAR